MQYIDCTVFNYLWLCVHKHCIPVMCLVQKLCLCPTQMFGNLQLIAVCRGNILKQGAELYDDRRMFGSLQLIAVCRGNSLKQWAE